MVKAINKQVLEIKDTGCEYFEKALFFVNPDYSEKSEEKLKKVALRTIQNSADFPKTKKQKRKNRLLFYGQMTVSAIIGAVLSALIILTL